MSIYFQMNLILLSSDVLDVKPKTSVSLFLCDLYHYHYLEKLTPAVIHHLKRERTLLITVCSESMGRKSSVVRPQNKETFLHYYTVPC